MDVVRPAFSHRTKEGQAECEEEAKTYSNALGFSYALEKKACNIYFSEKAPDMRGGECFKTLDEWGMFVSPCKNVTARDPNRDKNAPSKFAGEDMEFYSIYYYYSFAPMYMPYNESRASSKLAVPGPYTIDTASFRISCGDYKRGIIDLCYFYSYYTCFKFEESNADYAVTQNLYSCGRGNGYEPISSKEECQAAGDALGLGLKVKDTKDPSRGKDPQGCFLVEHKGWKYNPGALRWNGNSGTTVWTRAKRSVICKTIKEQA